MGGPREAEHRSRGLPFIGPLRRYASGREVEAAMAAIFGFAGYSGSAPERLQRMAQALAHRGAGDAGFFRGPRCGYRIAIQDRLKQSKPAAPSGWEGDELGVVLDGRIVNAPQLRGQLE